MVGLKDFIIGGERPDIPKPDRELAALQKQQLQNEKARERDLEAEESAATRSLNSRSRGRSLLAFADRRETRSETVG